MRKVNRASVREPESLAGPKSRGAKEYAKSEAHIQALQAAAPAPGGRAKKKKGFEFSAYSDDGVKYALDKLFFGKCAYCESRYAHQAPVDVEHFRPKGQIAGEVHPGYWWLAMKWDNLLPSCIDCNRRRWHALPEFPTGLEELLRAPEMDGTMAKLGKEDLFPIAGVRAIAPSATPQAESKAQQAEEALLLNPCIDDPDEHLVFHVDGDPPLGIVLPKPGEVAPSRKGLASIHVYGLNRLHLVQERTRVLRKLQFLSGLMDELDEVAEELRARRQADDATWAARLEALSDRILEEIRTMAADDQPYSNVVRTWARSLERG